MGGPLCPWLRASCGGRTGVVPAVGGSGAHGAAGGRLGGILPDGFPGQGAGGAPIRGHRRVDPLTRIGSFGSICPMEDNLIPLADCVAIFHRSRSTLYRWAEAGTIPTRRIGSTIYMHREDVERYTQSRGKINEELARRRVTHGRILDAETMTLLIGSLEDALAVLRAKKDIPVQRTDNDESLGAQDSTTNTGEQ